MTQSGNSLIGQEGHGSIKFSGLITSISWTSDKAEQSAYFQVGYDNPPPVVVFASGISPVIAYDPIFPSNPVNPDSNEAKPVPTVGYDDPRWTNPHNATSFPKDSHVWEYQSWVPTAFKFDANWINAWSNLSSSGHGKFLSSWNYYPYYGAPNQSWTKYTTTVTGSGSFVLQFLADNASWIYLDGQLVGYQDYFWSTNGTGRYTIDLTGSGPHELAFIIWDGGGLAGGKFRLETTQSFIDNNPGEELPPPPPPADSTAPVISAPANITAEATSPAGAVVTFAASAVDDVDGPVPVDAIPDSGSTFPLGSTTVGLGAGDAAGNMAYAEFSVTVQDTTPPVITPPANVVAEATSAAGATVSFTVPDATDIVSGSVTVGASPASGSTFALGATTVGLSAADAAGNAAAASFSVTVQDTTAPVITPPANIVAEATSAAGAAVSYAAATATDAVGVASLTYSVASGSTFALGTTTVTVTASDAAGNTSSGSFTVTVKDTTAPALIVPASITAEATSAAGAAVSYAAATATDAVGVASLTYSVASGSTFALGTTTVTVTASDAAGNTSSGSFTVTVKDTTAPALIVPASITAEATSAAGAAVSYAAATATDAVGVTSLTYSVASGSTFALGTTTVTVTASDAAGNTSSGSFTVTVQDTTAPAISSVTPSIRYIWPPNKKMVPVTVSVGANDAVGIASTQIVSVATNQPDSRTQWQVTGPLTVNLLADRRGDDKDRIYTITIEVRDAAGNVTTATTTVTVPHDQRDKDGDDDDDHDDKDGKGDKDKKDDAKKGKHK